MSGSALIWVSLQAVLFAVWVVIAGRILLRLRAAAVDRSGAPFPGPRASLGALRDFARAPGYRRDRRFLIVATAVLLAVSISTAQALVSR